MQFERFYQPQPSWSAIRMANGYFIPNITFSDNILSERGNKNISYIATYGFGVVTFANKTHLHYKSESDATLGDEHVDEFWIVKERKNYEGKN
jgi:hypothetical protein